MSLKDLEKNIYRRETRAKLDSDRKNLTKYTIYNQNLSNDKLEYQKFKEADTPFLSKYKKILTLFLGGGILIIVTIFVINQVYQFYLSRFVENNIIISFEGNSSLVATEETEYLVKYKNNNDVSIKDIQIDINLPDTIMNKQVFIYENDIEKISESQRFVIQKMDPKEEILIKIKGSILAEKNTIHTISTNFLYNSERVPTKLKQSSEYKINIIDNPIILDIAAPFDVASGEVVEYKITLNNKKSQDLSDLELRLEYPETLKIIDITKEASKDNNVFKIPILKGNGRYDFTIRGELIGNQSERKSVKGQIGKVIDDKFVVYGIDEGITRIAEAFVSIENFYPSTIKKDQDIKYSITIKNNTLVPIREGIIKAVFKSDVFDFSTLNTGGGDFDFNSKTITWRANTLPILEIFPPNATGRVSYNISLRKDLTEQELQNIDYKVSTFSLFESYQIPTALGVNKVIQGSDSIVSIERPKVEEKIPLIVKNQLLYDNSIPNIINSGPIPHKVSVPTTMTVIWEIEETNEDISDMTFRTYLPENVVATGIHNNFGYGKFTYNDRTKEVFWNLGDVPSGVNKNQNIKLAFQIQFTPSINQKSDTNNSAGKGPTVVNQVEYTAKTLKDGKVLDSKLEEIKTEYSITE